MSAAGKHADWMRRALERIPGGVNSPVRAWRGVGGTPLFFERGSGAWLVDIDGRRYLDYVGSWGALILGHAHPLVTEAITAAAARSTSFGAPTTLEVEYAELLCSVVPNLERVRLVNSGTEACMSAIRLARGATGRRKILKFDGCYHGHADSFLVRAGSGALTLGEPNSRGVTEGTAVDTLIAPYNDLPAVEALAAAHGRDLAAIIVEPVAGNMGCIPPAPGFLEGLRRVATASGAVLIFDEVMCGLRVAFGGAQARYGVDADLVTLGKIIGGGLPLAAYGGRADLMRHIAPEGGVYQAGTLSGNPLAVSAGLAVLRYLKAHPELYLTLEKRSSGLAQGLASAAREEGLALEVNQVGGMLSAHFSAAAVTDCASSTASDSKRFARFFHALLDEGVYLPPSAYEAWFVSLAHSAEDIERTLAAARKGFAGLAAEAPRP
jgi:glutamate-1-semialdehyde 2,1-aminomutase